MAARKTPKLSANAAYTEIRDPRNGVFLKFEGIELIPLMGFYEQNFQPYYRQEMRPFFLPRMRVSIERSPGTYPDVYENCYVNGCRGLRGYLVTSLFCNDYQKPIVVQIAPDGTSTPRFFVDVLKRRFPLDNYERERNDLWHKQVKRMTQPLISRSLLTARPA